jgi:hypothetical protein
VYPPVIYSYLDSGGYFANDSILQTHKPNKDNALRPMGDPCAIVKLSEVFSACYAEHHDDYLKVPFSAF